jgi:hypothetical protein
MRRLVVCAGLLALSSAVVAHAGPAPSDAEYHKLCRAIRPAHVRALFTAPAAPIQLGGTSDCAFFPRGGNALTNGVRVFLRIDDGDQTLWKHRGDHPYGTFRSLMGIAARVKWGYESGRLPSVVDARRGTFTCTVIPTVGGTKFTPSPGTAIAAARRYAQRLSLLCGDVFAAYF